VQISRRLGHKNPNVTLNIYAHLFKHDDSDAAAAMEAAMTRGRTPRGDGWFRCQFGVCSGAVVC
jgi:hypothetical protein